MNDYYHLYLNTVLEKLKVAEVLSEPFPHMILDLGYHIDYTKFDIEQSDSINGRASSPIKFTDSLSNYLIRPFVRPVSRKCSCNG